jgi:hypothetical protein
VKDDIVEKFTFNRRQGEQGVTIVLVAAAIVAILAMAALAIDIASLYVAHGEAQRAADAGALAGAQVMVAAGVTADPGNLSLQSTAQTLARQEATQIAQQNLIGGTPPSVNVSFPNAGSTAAFAINPQVTVSVTRSNPPVFFGRIWGATVASVSASATAEAFNPSNSSSVTASAAGVPIAPHCVKPWVIPNTDPILGSTFITASTGAITHPGAAPTGVIGESFSLKDNCKPPPGNLSGCNLSGYRDNPPKVLPGGSLEYIVPGYATSPPPSSALPSCAGSDAYEQNIEACNPSPFSCVGTNNGTVDFGSNTHQDTFNGLQCLIHQGSGQDTLDTTALPGTRIIAGAGNPLIPSVLPGNFVSVSRSVVTIPIFDDTIGPITASGQVNIIGFMQAFINNSGSGNGDIPITVLNISGCGAGSSLVPIVGAGTAVPVRLIHQ